MKLVRVDYNSREQLDQITARMSREEDGAPIYHTNLNTLNEKK